MIRSKKLLKKYKDVLELEVVIDENPADDDLLAYPLDTIIHGLYKANPDAHRLQKELASQRAYSVEEIQQADEILSPAESAVEVMVTSETEYPSYNHVAAKVVDAGDKLDKVILGEIGNLERAFNSDYKRVRKWKPSHGFNTIGEVRGRLRDAVAKFFPLLEVYERRSLPAKDVSSAKSLFLGYEEKLDVIDWVDAELAKLTNEYQAVSSLAHLKHFMGDSDLGARLKHSLLSKGDLVKACIKADYAEGLEAIRVLRKDMDYVLGNFEQVSKIRDRIISNTSRLEGGTERVNTMQEGTLSLDNVRELADILGFTSITKYDSHDGIIYLEEYIAQYKESAAELSALKDRVNEIVAKQAEADKVYTSPKNNLNEDIQALEGKRDDLGRIYDKSESENGVKSAIATWISYVGANLASLKQTSVTKQEIEADTKAVGAKLSEVNSLLIFIRSGQVDTNMNEIRALQVDYNPSAYNQLGGNPYLSETVSRYAGVAAKLEEAMKNTLMTTISTISRRCELSPA